MPENRNLISAILLSAAILFGWNYFFPQQKAPPPQPAQQTTQSAQPAAGTAAPTASSTTAPQAQVVAELKPRAEVLAQSPRVTIDTPSILGSISLKGGRIDDVELKKYREGVDPKSPIITLFSPKGTAGGYQAEFGWSGADTSLMPTPDTLWQASDTKLTPEKPVVLTWNNGKGLVFTRTIAVDDKSMFTVTDSVKNNTAAEMSLSPYGIIARYGKPKVEGYAVLHEGLIGVLGSNELQTYTYDAITKEAAIPGYDHAKRWENVTGGYVGFTDKYWASALIPDQSRPYSGIYSDRPAPTVGNVYQTTAWANPLLVPANGSVENTQRLFVGAKEIKVLADYQDNLKIAKLDLLIDWGWFWFFVRPLAKFLGILYNFVGNFGVAIMLLTLLIKLIFLPLANKSYASMAKMKAVQPEMTAIRERYADDKTKQQQALMELYKKEKINPVSGCWPMLIQIPVFFALYKVLFVSIDMRQAPFFGWIKDLSAPDPTTIFNLFGLLPFDPSTVPFFGPYLMLGAWALVMGITMWLQMKMNPAAGDPTQQMMFSWMPVIFTFMLAHFPVGLVIYWAWNNFLSILQQYYIMRKNGVKVELWDNLRGLGKKKPAAGK